jgi:putative ABC transport system substrate-binding protein
MRRRDFITLIGGATAWPLAVQAQQAGVPVIGLLGSSAAVSDIWTRNVTAFRQGLKELGYIERQNVAIEERWADGQYDRLPAMATDLIQHQAALIVAFTTPAATAAKKATSNIPIVFTTIANPVQIGLVASLNRPGGNVTGVTLLSVEIGPKLLELLHDAVPNATSVGLLVNPTNPNIATQLKNLQAAALEINVQVHVVNASSERDFDAAFAKLRELRAGALMISQDSLFNSKSGQLAALSLSQAMPAIYVDRDFAAAGGLMSYGTSQSDAYRQVGLYAGRILNGEKPADLPVMQPTKFELTINLKTAKALGLAVPNTLLVSADEVIE